MESTGRLEVRDHGKLHEHLLVVLAYSILYLANPYAMMCFDGRRFGHRRSGPHGGAERRNAHWGRLCIYPGQYCIR